VPDHFVFFFSVPSTDTQHRVRAHNNYCRVYDFILTLSFFHFHDRVSSSFRPHGNTKNDKKINRPRPSDGSVFYVLIIHARVVHEDTIYTIRVYQNIVIFVYKKAIKNPLERLSGSPSVHHTTRSFCAAIFYYCYFGPPVENMRAHARRLYNVPVPMTGRTAMLRLSRVLFYWISHRPVAFR